MVCVLLFYNTIVCNMPVICRCFYGMNIYKTYHLKVTGKCFEINITSSNEQVKHMTCYIMTGIMLHYAEEHGPVYCDIIIH